MPDKTDMAEGTPRWVKVFGVVALLVIAVVLVLILTGRGGPHSPRRHIAPAATTPTGGEGGHTGPPPGITHTQP
jgi:hypothetical protein